MKREPLTKHLLRYQPVPALRRGDGVGIAAPASPVPREEFHAALHNLRRMGLRPIYRSDIFERYLYLARPDATRAAELAELFANPDVKAIFCACPGYGSLRLLPLLPWPEIRKHPKIIMGYSDLTVLMLAIHTRCGFATFHGPTLVPGFLPEELSRPALTAIRRTLFRADVPHEFRIREAQILGEGTATGRLVGGNLDMLTSLVGTPWEPDTAGAILFLEDVDESEESLDQYLTHLRLAGLFEGVRGVIFGDMSGNPLTPPFRITEVVRNALGDLGIPILLGFPAGHGSRNLPLVIGARYTLCTKTRTVVQLESGVTAT